MNRCAIMTVAALLLAGCGSSGDPVAAPSATQEAQTASASASASASATPTLSPTPTVLTVEQAAELYEAIICKANKAAAPFAEAYANGYVDQQLSEGARKSAAKAAKGRQRAARALVAEQWPPEVAEDVEKVAQGMYEHAAVMLIVAEKGYRWTGEEDFSAGSKASSRVRLALGLPPRGDC